MQKYRTETRTIGGREVEVKVYGSADPPPDARHDSRFRIGADNKPVDRHPRQRWTSEECAEIDAARLGAEPIPPRRERVKLKDLDRKLRPKPRRRRRKT